MRIKKAVESLVASRSSSDVAAIERELTKLEQRRAGGELVCPSGDTDLSIKT